MISSRGFTLIELVVVIVILGTLAATAAPKYVDLSTDANIAKAQALKGAVQSASNMVHVKAELTGQQESQLMPDGSTVKLTHGYPAAEWDGIMQALDIDFTYAIPWKGLEDPGEADWYYSNWGIVSISMDPVYMCGVEYFFAGENRQPTIRVRLTECDQF